MFSTARRVKDAWVQKRMEHAAARRAVKARRAFNALRRVNAVPLYQPVPWLNCPDSHRSDATLQRWQAIERELAGLGQPGAAMDLGAQLGYFSLRMGEAGWLCLAVEASPVPHEMSRLIQQAAAIPNVAHRRMQLDAESVHRLPRVDVVLFLSLWHHLCRVEGFDKAKHILREVLRRTGKVCFFETGQSDETHMAWARTLPAMEPDPRTWLARLLIECGARHVCELGQFEAFRGPAKRHLLAAYTQPSTAEVSPVVMSAGAEAGADQA